MAQVGTLTVDLIAQTAAFNANIEKAARNLNSNAARMSSALRGVQNKFDAVASAARVAGLAIAGGALIEGARRGLDYASSLGEVSQQLGVSTRDLQVFRYIGSQVGVTQEEMDAGLRKLTVSIGQAATGAQGQATAFGALGISLRDANGHVKTAGQMLPEIAEALSRIPDPAQRAAMEVALLGRAGQKLDTLMTEGKAGIKGWAKEADDAGLIIKDELINSADKAADKISKMNRALQVNLASAVAQNAGAILGLANAVSTLTVRGLELVANYPRISSAIAGAAIGARIGGGYGAAAGALIGGIAGEGLASQNMDLNFRRGEHADALAVYNRVKRIAGTPPESAQVTKDLRRETALLRDAIRFSKQMSKPPAVPELQSVNDLPQFLGGSSGQRTKADKTANRAAEEARRNAESFANDLARLNADVLSAKRDTVTEAWQLADIARQQLEVDTSQLRASIDADVVGQKYTRAQADQLLAVVDQAKAQKALSINIDYAERLAAEALRVDAAANDNQRDLLEVQDRLAVTAQERRTIQLNLLAIDKQEEQLRLQSIIASRQSTDAERRIAEARLGQLDAIYAGRTASVKQQTEGPMEAYRRDLALTATQINEAIEGIQVQGLQALNQGLVDAIMGVKSLGDAFREVTAQIVADLLKLAIQQTIIAPLAGALGLKMPGFASGTSFAPGGMALVGEAGPEIVNLPKGSKVIPSPRSAAMLGNAAAAMAAGARGRDRGGQTFNITVNGAMNARDARETGAQIALAAQRRLAGAARSGIAA